MRLLLAAGVIGFASLHQALHRKGIHHLFQVIAPWIVAAFVLTDLLVRSLLRGSGSRGTLAAVALAWLVLATWTGAGLVKYGRVDLEPFDAWPMTRFASLANPLQGRAPGPLVTPIKRLRQLTRPDDSILIYPLDPQLYAPAERRMSGMLHAYYPGVYSDPPWSTHNLAAIQADPPAVILVPSGFGAVPDPESGFGEHRTSHAYLDEFLRSNYTRVLFDDGLRMLLGPTTGRRRQGRRRHSRRGYAGRALRARRSIRRGSPATPFRCGHAGAIRTGVGTRARTSGEVAQYSCATFSP
jgi:hypothetical protein